MELHKTNIISTDRPDFDSGPEQYFTKAKEFAYANYSDEIKRIWSTKLEDISPHIFFREYIWTVHTTGFSAKAVSRFFPRLMDAYGPYQDLSLEDLGKILKVCNNKQKASAVIKTAQFLTSEIYKYGWREFRASTLSSPELLQKLPYIGKITCFHLARNIGILDSVKPDLHLVRMAKHWGFGTCIDMCKSMQKDDMPLGIIDLILWYQASTTGTLNIKLDGER